MATETLTTQPTLAAALAACSLHQLSFVAHRPEEETFNLWSPPEVEGGWAEQCRVGRELGCEAVAHIRTMNDAALLPGIVRTIAERGTFGGVEVGFFAAVSMHLAHSVDR